MVTSVICTNSAATVAPALVSVKHVDGTFKPGSVGRLSTTASTEELSINDVVVFASWGFSCVSSVCPVIRVGTIVRLISWCTCPACVSSVCPVIGVCTIVKLI